MNARMKASTQFWLRRLSARARHLLRRQKREFLPIRPIWRRT